MFGKKKKEGKKVTKKDKVKFIKSLQEIYESKKGFNKVNIKEETNDNSSTNNSESTSNFYVYRGFLIPQQKSLFESGLFIDNVKNIEITKIFKNVKLKSLLDEKKMDKEYLKEQYALFQSLYPYYLAKYGLNLEKDNEIFIGPYMKYTNKNNIEIEKNFNASSQMTFAIQTHSYIPDQLHGGMGTAALKALQSSGSMSELKKQAEKAAKEKGMPGSLDKLKEQAEKAAKEKGLPGSMDELKKKAEKAAKEKGLPGSLDEMKEQAEKKAMNNIKKEAEKQAKEHLEKSGLPTSFGDAEAFAKEQLKKSGLPTSMEDAEKSLNAKLNQGEKGADSNANDSESQNQNASKSKKQNENSIMNVEAVEVQNNGNTPKNNDGNVVMNAEAVEIEEAQTEIANNNELSENGTIEVSPENVSMLNMDGNESQQTQSRSSNNNMSSVSTSSSSMSSSRSQSNQKELAKMVRRHETEIQELKSSQQEALQNNDNETKLFTIHSFNSFNNLCNNRDGVLLVLCFLSMNHNQRIDLIQGNFFKSGKPVNEVLQDFYEIYKDTTATTEQTDELGLKHYFGFNEKLDKEAKKEIRKVIKESNKKPSLFKRLFGKKSKGGTKKKVRFSIKNKSKKDHLRIIKLKKKPKFTTKLYKNKNKLKMTRKNIK